MACKVENTGSATQAAQTVQPGDDNILILLAEAMSIIQQSMNDAGITVAKDQSQLVTARNQVSTISQQKYDDLIATYPELANWQNVMEIAQDVATGLMAGGVALGIISFGIASGGMAAMFAIAVAVMIALVTMAGGVAGIIEGVASIKVAGLLNTQAQVNGRLTELEGMTTTMDVGNKQLSSLLTGTSKDKTELSQTVSDTMSKLTNAILQALMIARSATK